MDAYDLHKFAATALPAPPALADVPVNALTNDQRRIITGWLGYLYLPTATTKRMETQLRSVIERNSCSRPGAKTIPIVTAINGMGKSTMMLELCRQFYLEQIPAQRLIVGTLPTFNPQLGVHAAHIPIVWLNVGSADGKGGPRRRDLRILRIADHRLERRVLGTRATRTANTQSQDRRHRRRPPTAHTQSTGPPVARPPESP